MLGNLSLSLNVRKHIRKSEILDYVQRDFGEYPWSESTLTRRLRHLGIRYIDYDTPS